MATIRNGFPADKFPAQLGLKQNWHLPEFDDNAYGRHSGKSNG